MTKRYAIFLIFILLIQIKGRSQSNNLFFELTSGSGRLYPTPKMKNLAGPVTFLNARLGLKTLGKKEWQRIYNYPEIGVGLSHNYLTTRLLGNPTAVYSFMNLPLLTDAKFKLNLGMHLGLTWGFNPYKGQYPQDIVIGSQLAVYTSLNLNTSFRITQRIEFLLAAEAYHSSDGNTNKPNKGINLLGAEAGVRYMLSDPVTLRNTDPVLPIQKNSTITVYGAWGWMRESTAYATKCAVGSLSTGYYRTMSHKSRLGAGVDLFYNEGDLYQTQNARQLKDLLSAGLFFGHELTFDKLAIVTQVGIYVRNPCTTDPFFYERAGLRYAISKRIISSVTIKVHGVDADFVEWGVGFVLWNTANTIVH